MIVSDIRDELLTIMQTFNFSQTFVAKELSVTQGAIEHWLKKRRFPREQHYRKLLKFINKYKKYNIYEKNYKK